MRILNDNKLMLEGDENILITFLGENVVNFKIYRRLEPKYRVTDIESLRKVKVYISKRDDRIFAGDGRINITYNLKKQAFKLSCNNIDFCAHNVILSNKKYFIHIMWRKEYIYGLGEKAVKFNRRGLCLRLLNMDPSVYRVNDDPLYLNIPFLLMIGENFSYGFFLNTIRESIFDLCHNNNDKIVVESHGLEANYYIIFGRSPIDVIREYTKLVGRAPLPPLWALGYHQSRAPFPPIFPIKILIGGYKNEKNILKVAEEFRKRKIPCDVIYLDIDYMDNFKPFTWHPKRFKNYRYMLKKLNRMGFKVVTIIDPYIKYEPQSLMFKKYLEKNFFVKRDDEIFIGYGWPGKTVFPDFTREEVREWWAQLHKDLLESGVSGIWNDMNEPTFNVRLFGKKDFSGVRFYAGSLDEFRNIYANLMAIATWNAFKLFKKNKRPYILSRSGYAGIQKYAAVWTGDNISNWSHLRLSISMILSLGLCGLPFVGADIGGWAKIMTKKPYFAKCTPELFARWIQLGIFYPLCRSHSMIFSQEPWVFGQNVENIAKKYIRLRYRLIPYIYSLFWEHTQNGMPIMRPLFLYYPEDDRSHRDDEFLLGPFMLIAPVLERGSRSRVVYLPSQVWYDYWSMKKYEGGVISVKAPLDTIPIFIRSGAIIPTQPVLNYIRERMVDVTLEIYPGNGSFTLYEDDGITINSKYSLTKIINYMRGDKWNVIIERRRGEYNPRRKLYVYFRGIEEAEKILVNDKSVRPIELRRDGFIIDLGDNIKDIKINLSSIKLLGK